MLNQQEATIILKHFGFVTKQLKAPKINNKLLIIFLFKLQNQKQILQENEEIF